MPNPKNSAKFAFFYMLSLVALIFMSTSAGMIIFQIINKTLKDPAGIYSGQFSSEALRYAISALIIASPIYYFVNRLIFKNLFSGEMEKDSGIRRWLTYFILFVSAVVMIGWLIAALNSFLNGELTAKFILKSLTSILLSALIFVFYFYDIKREAVQGKSDKIVMGFFFGSAAIALSVLVAGFFFIESPAVVRQKRHDQQVIQNLDTIFNTINLYFNKENSVPESLAELIKDPSKEYFIVGDTLKDPQSGEMFEYKKIKTDTYELCASFLLSGSAEDTEDYDKYLGEKWKHEAGRQCFERTAEKFKSYEASAVKAVPAR